MNKADIFYLIFVATIVSVRLGIYLLPKAKVRIFQRGIHHFWIGVILVFISFAFVWWRGYWIILALGLALIADESVYMFLEKKPVKGRWRSKTYWSATSIIGALASCIVVFLIRGWFVSF